MLCHEMSKMKKLQLKPRNFVVLSALFILVFAGTSSVSVAGGDIYSYDALGRLREVTNSTGDVVTYMYDAAGNRISVGISKQSVAIQGSFSYVSNGGHSANGGAGDLITFTIRNTGSGTINSASATCSGGSFVNYGNFSASVLAPNATGTIQCRAAASGSYFAAKVTMQGSNVSNAGVIFGPY